MTHLPAGVGAGAIRRLLWAAGQTSAGLPGDQLERGAWTRGCPVGIPSPGTLLVYGSRLRETVGRIHWAGTGSATYWNGYMDGAGSWGERPAAEVLAKL